MRVVGAGVALICGASISLWRRGLHPLDPPCIVEFGRADGELVDPASGAVVSGWAADQLPLFLDREPSWFDELFPALRLYDPNTRPIRYGAFEVPVADVVGLRSTRHGRWSVVGVDRFPDFARPDAGMSGTWRLGLPNFDGQFALQLEATGGVFTQTEPMVRVGNWASAFHCIWVEWRPEFQGASARIECFASTEGARTLYELNGTCRRLDRLSP